jgi:hypothetical protein
MGSGCRAWEADKNGQAVLASSAASCKCREAFNLATFGILIAVASACHVIVELDRACSVF